MNGHDIFWCCWFLCGLMASLFYFWRERKFHKKYGIGVFEFVFGIFIIGIGMLAFGLFILIFCSTSEDKIFGNQKDED
jgi:hypothetical protein